MLCSEVRNYISTAKGLPFFYVVGDEDYNSTLDELVQAGLAVVRISDYCSKEDKFPSIDELVDYFRTSDIDYRDNKYVVVGLGEFLAIRGETIADKELRRLKNTTLGSARAVLLMRGISSRAERMIKEDNRISSQQRAFISPHSFCSVTITNIPNGTGLANYGGIKTLLHRLEDGASGKVFASTSMYMNDSLLPVSNLVGSYSVIRAIINEFPFTCDLGNDAQWGKLLSDLGKSKNRIEAVYEKYGVSEDIIDDLYVAISGLEYKNWLVFLYLKDHKNNIQNPYLKLVVEATDSFEDLKMNLLLKITEFSYKDPSFRRLYDARKKLLKDFPDADVALFVKRNEADPEESIYRLTDNTELERKAIIKWISHHGLSEAVSYVYPALHAYLKKYVFTGVTNGAELTDYFETYKNLKVTNRITEDFIGQVERHAKALTYAKLPSRDNAIMAIKDKGSAFLYWIDALGVEYLAYIVELARKKGLSIQVDIARSDLPTITSVNKQFYEQWTGFKKFKEERLDDIKHKEKGGYFFTDDEDPIHIPAELEVIEKAMNIAAMELGLHNCKSFVIASDHGASRLAVIKKEVVPYDTDTKGEHSGRCCKSFEGCELPYKAEDNGYIVLSDYGRFRGSRAANVEVHGGASLEEIVVPVITLKLRKNAGVQIEVIQPDSITADRHEGVTLKLYISDIEARDSVSMVINGKTYSGRAEDETHFEFKLNDVKRAMSRPYIGEVYDSSDLIGTVSFKVKGKAAQVKDDFDFDDDF